MNRQAPNFAFFLSLLLISVISLSNETSTSQSRNYTNLEAQSPESTIEFETAQTIAPLSPTDISHYSNKFVITPIFEDEHTSIIKRDAILRELVKRRLSVKTKSEKIYLSEKLGTYARQIFIERDYPGSIRLFEGKGRDFFDAIYWCCKQSNKNDFYIIIEDKGGKSPLGTRKVDEHKVKQGHPAYVKSIALSMKDKLKYRRWRITIQEQIEKNNINISLDVLESVLEDIIRDVEHSKLEIVIYRTGIPRKISDNVVVSKKIVDQQPSIPHPISLYKQPDFPLSKENYEDVLCRTLQSEITIEQCKNALDIFLHHLHLSILTKFTPSSNFRLTDEQFLESFDEAFAKFGETHIPQETRSNNISLEHSPNVNDYEKEYIDKGFDREQIQKYLQVKYAVQIYHDYITWEYLSRFNDSLTNKNNVPRSNDNPRYIYCEELSHSNSKATRDVDADAIKSAEDAYRRRRLEILKCYKERYR